MKKILGFIALLSIFIFHPFSVKAAEVHIYLFYGKTCPICERERAFLETIKETYKDVRIFEFETYEHRENDINMQVLKEKYHISGTGVPFTIVGDTAIYGFSDATKTKIKAAINQYQEEDYYDRAGVYLGLFEDEEIQSTPTPTPTNTPVSNKIEEKKEQNSIIDWKLSFLIVLLIAIFFILWFKQNKQKSF